MSSPIFEIDPRHYPRDSFHLGMVMLWCLIFMVLFSLTVYMKFWLGIFLGTAILIGVIFSIWRNRNRGDRFEVIPEGLHYSNFTPYCSGFVIPKAHRIHITLEHVRSGKNHGRESVATLNLWRQGPIIRERTILGYWLNLESKRQVMTELTHFLQAHGFDVEFIDTTLSK